MAARHVSVPRQDGRKGVLFMRVHEGLHLQQRLLLVCQPCPRACGTGILHAVHNRTVEFQRRLLRMLLRPKYLPSPAPPGQRCGTGARWQRLEQLKPLFPHTVTAPQLRRGAGSRERSEIGKCHVAELMACGGGDTSGRASRGSLGRTPAAASADRAL